MKLDDLPSDMIPKTRWYLVTPEIKRTEIYAAIRAAYLSAVRGPGWNPPTVQLGGFLRAIDYCGHPSHHVYDENGDEIDHSHPHSYKVALVMDHPFLATLPTNAPRSVRHMLRAETRMRWLRMTDVFGFLEDSNRAKTEWQTYRAAVASRNAGVSP